MISWNENTRLRGFIQKLFRENNRIFSLTIKKARNRCHGLPYFGGFRLLYQSQRFNQVACSGVFVHDEKNKADVNMDGAL
jgi:hypothetical protein